MKRASIFPGSDRLRVATAAGIIGLVVFLAYATSFHGPFVFDDLPSIAENPTIRDLGEAWRPPADRGQTVGGRPLVNVTLAINYAWGGLRVEPYHVTNLLIHLAAALTLFGLMRRVLLLPRWRDYFARGALPLAAVIASLWGVHPVQTAAVTYVVQRAESLCGLFYLLTLYAFVRGATAPVDMGLPRSRGAARAWFAVAVVSCVAGMATKEVMVTAPLMVLLFDRIFLTESWRELVRRRGAVHVSLMATWLLLAGLVAGTRGRAGSAGWGSAVSGSDYALTQVEAAVHYLRLAFWPHPLVFDHGTALALDFRSVAPQAALLVGLLAATVWLFRRSAPLGYGVLWFFVILSPSSSVLPIATQTMAEHRLYLSLAAVITGVALALYRWLDTKAIGVLAVLTVGAAVLTGQRNADYQSALTLWETTARHRPENARAWLNWGVQLAERGRVAEAVVPFRAAVRLAPNDSDARNNLANALDTLGQRAEALQHYEAAVRLGPLSPKARHNFGQALAAEGRWADAREQLTESVRSGGGADAQVDLGRVLLQIRATTEAEAAFRAALQIRPTMAAAHVGLGEVFARSGRLVEAEAAFREALRMDPTSAGAHHNLGHLLLVTRRAAEAVSEFQAALAAGANSALTHANLGIALVLTGRTEQGRGHLQRALEIDPANALARSTLSRLPAP